MTPRIPPPLIAATAGLLTWVMAQYLPLLPMPIPFNTLVAGLLGLIGAVTCLLGVVSFRRARTTVNPLRPEQTSTLVVEGIYRFSRNPMYLGFAIALLGWVVYLSEWSALLAVAAFIAYINRFQIKPEETALERRFGETFLKYKQTVRRWL